MPAARADTSDRRRRRRGAGRRLAADARVRAAVSRIARRWRAGAELRRALAPVPALVPARVPTSRAAARRHAGTGGRDGGFTLVEVMIAFVVLLIVLVPVASVLANSISQAASSRERLTALSLAEQYIELLNNTPFGPATVNRTPTYTALPKLGTHTPILQKSGVVRSSVSYDVYAEFNWASAGGATPDLCTSGLTPKVIALQVTVRWSHTTQHVTDTTVINYPPAGLEPYGFLAVQVNGDPAGGPPNDAGGRSWATRVQTVPVQVQSLTGTTPPTTKTVRPNAYGCAFEEVPPGTYKVSLSNPAAPTAPSWVANANEQTAVTQSPLTVSAGEVTTATFQYDEGSLVSLHFPSTTATDGLVTCPAAGTVECLVAGQAPATSAKPASTPVAELSVRTPSGWTVTRPGMARVAAVACAGTTRCLAVGYALTGSSGTPYADSVSTPTGSTAPHFTQDAVPSGVTSFDTITCPSATTCYAVGSGGSGAVLLSATVSGTGATWTLDAAPSGLTSVSSLRCPSATTCFATASITSGPTILSLSGTSWVADTLPATPATTGLGQVSCASSTSCYAIATISSGAELLSLAPAATPPATPPAAPSWVADTLQLPAGDSMTALTQLACPGTSVCYAIGTVNTGTSTVGGVLSLSTASGSPPSWVLDTAPTTTLASLTCPTTTVCVAAGPMTAPPVLLSPRGSTSWKTDAVTLPAGTTLDSVPAVGCSPGGHCDAVAVVTTTTTEATILSLSPTTWRWREGTLTGATPVSLTGVACGTSTCAAAGATETGAVYLDGTTTSSTWKGTTPSGAAGLYLADAPIAVQDANLRTAATQVVGVPATSATDLSRIGPLFPFTGGYSVAAAQCATELRAAAATVTSVPGATATATLPLGLLPLEVVNGTTGAPVSGATVSATITDSTCAPLTPVSGGTDPSSYSLETTGPLGQSAIAVIYDTYTVTVRAPDGHTATVTAQVTPSATVVGSQATPLPFPVVVHVT